AVIRLHGLEGNAAHEIFERLKTYSNQPVNEGVSALLGGFLTGALSGLVADFAAGGLTFGGGALVGGIRGAAGAGALAKGYNTARGEDVRYMRWSLETFEGLVRSALLRYLAVAHFGRGRGEYAEGEHPKLWQDEVRGSVGARHEEIKSIWEQGKSETDPE